MSLLPSGSSASSGDSDPSWALQKKYHISELDEYYDTKTFVNDPSCPWHQSGGSAYSEGFAPAGGSAPASFNI